MVPTASHNDLAQRRVGLHLKLPLHRRIILGRLENGDGFVHRSGQIMDCQEEEFLIEVIAGIEDGGFEFAVLDVKVCIASQQIGSVVRAQTQVRPCL